MVFFHLNVYSLSTTYFWPKISKMKLPAENKENLLLAWLTCYLLQETAHLIQFKREIFCRPGIENWWPTGQI